MMLRDKLKKYLQLCTGTNKYSQPKSNVFVEVLVLNVMVRRRLTRKDLLHISIGSLLLLVTAFILTYGVILHHVDRKLHMARIEGSDKSLSQIGNRNTKRVKFKLIPRLGSNAAEIDAVSNRVAVWKPSAFHGKTSKMPNCVSNAKFLVLITSSPAHLDRRSAIRKTWCNPYASEQSQDSWQCVFLIGAVEDITLRNKVHKESNLYRDILIGSYVDSYRNLTYKVMNGLSWSKTFCPIDFVLKTDDDCFVNTKILYQFLMQSNDKTKDLYAGNIFMEDSNRPVIRSKLSKWHVSEDSFSGDNYPAYASGTGYIMSQDVVSRIADECVYHKPIPIEDAYTGIVVKALGNIEPVQSGRFMTFSSGLSLCNYLYFFVSHNVAVNEQFEMHNKMLKAHTSCRNKEEVTSWF